MSAVINPADLASCVLEELHSWNGATADILRNAADTAAGHALSTLKQSAPKQTGGYRKGWRIKKGNSPGAGGFYTVKVHNKGRYQLTHLLEHGHQKVAAGRVRGTVAAKPHLAGVQAEAAAEFETLVLEGIRNGG